MTSSSAGVKCLGIAALSLTLGGWVVAGCGAASASVPQFGPQAAVPRQSRDEACGQLGTRDREGNPQAYDTRERGGSLLSEMPSIRDYGDGRADTRGHHTKELPLQFHPLL